MDPGSPLKLPSPILPTEKGEDDEEKLDPSMGLHRNNVPSPKYTPKIFTAGAHGKKIGYVHPHMSRYCTSSSEIFHMVVVLFHADDKGKKKPHSMLALTCSVENIVL